MLEVADELRQRITNGEVCSLTIVAETVAHKLPHIAVKGRFERDPIRATAALQYAIQRLLRTAESCET